MTSEGRIHRGHPLRSTTLTGGEVGWFRPAAAVVIGLILPSAFALILVYFGGPTFSGPPKNGAGFSLSEHVGLVLGVLSVSFIISWMAAPFALFALRAMAMLGYAGWGSAVLSAWAIGLPIVHIVLNADATTDESAILLPMTVALGVLGLSVWVTFQCLLWFGTRTRD